VFNLPENTYLIRANYLGREYWTDAFTAMDAEITIPEGIASVTVTQGAELLENVNVYVFSTADAYLGLSAATDVDGQVAFRLPAGTYKFRADHMNSQFWATAAVAGNATNDIALSTGGGSFALTVQKEKHGGTGRCIRYTCSALRALSGPHGHHGCHGQVSFTMADGDYRFRADYWATSSGHRITRFPITSQMCLAIAHQDVTVTVNEKFGVRHHRPREHPGVSIYRRWELTWVKRDHRCQRSGDIQPAAGRLPGAGGCPVQPDLVGGVQPGRCFCGYRPRPVNACTCLPADRIFTMFPCTCLHKPALIWAGWKERILLGWRRF
jgi:hypothetical protein